MGNLSFSEFKRVYEMLEDDESKEIYIARLNFLLSNKFEYFKSIIEKYLPNAVARDTGKDINTLIASLPENKNIILYGAGNDARISMEYWRKDKRFIGFCDRAVEKQKNGYLGYPVMSPTELLKQQDISVVISTHTGLVEVKQFLLESGFPAENIYVMAEYMFCVEQGQYFDTDFMCFEDKEIFVDAGCKDFFSSFEMIKYCKNLNKIYAFEPDCYNYQDCLKLKDKLHGIEVELFEYGTWSKKDTLYFSATGDGSSHITNNGDMAINVMAIDDAVDPDDRITFIKMDVEGSELESLKGAKGTIQKYKPKLAICIYHKEEDMTEIPLYIKELVPEYKLFIRHHSNMAGETVLYAMP